MAQTRVLLLSAAGKPREAYLKRLQELEVTFDAIEDFSQLEGKLMETPYSGILLDVPTLVQSGGAKKASMHGLLERFPVLRLMFDAKKGKIRGLAFGHTVRSVMTLREFLATVCANFEARTIRISPRKQLNVSTLIFSKPGQGLDEAEKSVTMNVSALGCFVYSTNAYEKGDQVWLLFKGVDHRPVAATVRWHVPWGTCGKVPGIGVKFDGPSPFPTDEQDISTGNEEKPGE